jgi:hypothetical protein
MRPHRSRRPAAGHGRNPAYGAVFTDPMTGTTRSTTGPRHRARHLLAFAGLCAALVALAVAIASPVGAISPKVIGKTKHTPPPSCPKDTAAHPCAGLGRVTGFQLVADGTKRPFNVHKEGKIVAWALSLSKPTKSQRDFFAGLFKNDKFGKAPTARLAVIKHKGKRKYKLLKESPAVKLNSALGQKEIFTLDKPLKIRKGQIVALTIPTWASSFANSVSSSGNQWRSSRNPPNCSPKSTSSADLKAFAKASKPQQKVGSTRNYGCDYKAGRLLYWAYYVPA